PPGAVTVALGDRRLCPVDSVGGRFDVDPRRGRQSESKAVPPPEAAELREQRREAAVAAIGPERIQQLRTRQRPVAIGGEKGEQQPSLAAGKPLLDPLVLQLDDEPAAQLDFRPRQSDANIVPTTPTYKGAVMSKQITCECGF